MEFSVLVHQSLPKLSDDFKRKAVTLHFSAQNYLLLGILTLSWLLSSLSSNVPMENKIFHLCGNVAISRLHILTLMIFE